MDTPNWEDVFQTIRSERRQDMLLTVLADMLALSLDMQGGVSLRRIGSLVKRYGALFLLALGLPQGGKRFLTLFAFRVSVGDYVFGSPKIDTRN